MDYIGPRGIGLDDWNGWSDYAQSAALGWQDWERGKCVNGHHPSMWDPLEGGDLLNQVRPGIQVCPACAQFSQAQKEAGERTPPAGAYWTWKPLPPEERGEQDVGDGQDEQDEEPGHDDAAESDHDGGDLRQS